MADNNDTSTPVDGTQDGATTGTPVVNPPASGEGDDVSVLRSRYAGQTAKVNELAAQKQALEAAKADLEKKLAEAQTGVASKDDAAKALLAAKDAEIAAIRREATVARIEAKYPEVYRELGDDAVALTEEKLAAMEARLSGGGEAHEPPPPRGQNPARTDGVPAGGREPKAETSADIIARLRTMAVPSEWGG
jgi:hypothetical protein